ncbi:MAG TPA: hypothetical protein VK400_18650 [Pyrinomonadaceae bacterium]|nr:hypothetical protein [Pyrinomonadaceae bacterium]
MKKLITSFITLAFILATTPFVLAADYDIELVVQDGKESKETDAVLRVNEDSFQIIIEKQRFKAHEKSFTYKDIKTADYSFSKKPMLSGGGAVATALLVGFIFALPFLFIKKKNHWLTVQGEKDFAVMKLGASNFRAIVADLKTRGVDVKEVKEEVKGK